MPLTESVESPSGFRGMEGEKGAEVSPGSSSLPATTDNTPMPSSSPHSAAHTLETRTTII